MRHFALVLSFLSLVVVVIAVATKFMNAPFVLESGGSSYSDLSAFLYVVSGFCSTLVGVAVFRVHRIGSLIPLGLGVSGFVYGCYILWVKEVVFV